MVVVVEKADHRGVRRLSQQLRPVFRDPRGYAHCLAMVSTAASTPPAPPPAHAGGETQSLPPELEERLSCLLREGASTPAGSPLLADLPPWFDEAKFRRGQEFFWRNFFALFVAKLCGLLALLAVPSVVRVLALTGRSSRPLDAFRRYASTLTHMLSWYDGDVHDPASKAVASLRGVVGKHCAASRMASRGGAAAVSQLDMALTQFAFMGFALLRPRRLGLDADDRDIEGFLHFWRVVGHLLGIEERFNVCTGSVEENRALCEALLRRVLAPALLAPPPRFAPMALALLKGMRPLVPSLDADAFLAFTHRLAGISAPEPTPLYSRAMLALQLFVHQLLSWRIAAWLLRPFLNMQLRLAVFLAQRWPLLILAEMGMPSALTPFSLAPLKAS